MKRKILFSCLMFLGIWSFAQTAKDFTQKGRELYEKGEYMEALLNFNKAIEVDHNYSPAYYMRGNIKEAFEDFQSALKDYDIAIEKNPNVADMFFERGSLKMNLQDYYGAIDDFSAAIAINEHYIEAYFYRGKAKQFLLAYEDAINDCTRIIQINPKNRDAYYMRGILRIAYGDAKNGCLDLSKAGELGDFKAYEAIKEKCTPKYAHHD